MLTGILAAIALFALVAATLTQVRSTRDGANLAAHDQPRRTPPPDHRAIHGVTGMLHAAVRV